MRRRTQRPINIWSGTDRHRQLRFFFSNSTEKSVDDVAGRCTLRVKYRYTYYKMTNIFFYCIVALLKSACRQCLIVVTITS